MNAAASLDLIAAAGAYWAVAIYTAAGQRAEGASNTDAGWFGVLWPLAYCWRAVAPLLGHWEDRTVAALDAELAGAVMARGRAALVADAVMARSELHRSIQACSSLDRNPACRHYRDGAGRVRCTTGIHGMAAGADPTAYVDTRTQRVVRRYE